MGGNEPQNPDASTQDSKVASNLAPTGQGQEVPINSEDVFMQPPNVADFLSPKLMQAIDQLALRDKGMDDWQQGFEGKLSPRLGPHQDTSGNFAVEAEFFEALAAEVASAARRTMDFWSPSNAWSSFPLPPQGLRSDTSALAKGVAFAAASAAADAAAAAGASATDAESAAPHVTAEDYAADEDASEWEWWW